MKCVVVIYGKYSESLAVRMLVLKGSVISYFWEVVRVWGCGDSRKQRAAELKR